LIDPALRLVQNFGQAAQFGAERPPGSDDLAQGSPKLQQTLPDIAPVDQPAADFGGIIAPCQKIGFGHGTAAQRAHRFRIVDGKTRGLHQGTRGHARPGAKDNPVEPQIAVMIGEAQHHTIPAPHPPGPAQGCDPARKMGQQVFARRHQTRSSTTGTDGTSPA